MKVPQHLNYTQAFSGPFRATPPGTRVEVSPLLGLSGPFPGNAGPFVTPSTGYAGLGADAAPKLAAPVSPVAGAKPAAAAETAGASTIPVPGAMPRVPVAADDTSSALRTINKVAGYAGYMAGAYHGYKRNESVAWAFGWALFGGLIWPLAIPVMFAQGFGKPLPKVAAANRRKAKRNGFKIRTGDLVPAALVKDVVGKNMVAYPSFEKES